MLTPSLERSRASCCLRGETCLGPAIYDLTAHSRLDVSGSDAQPLDGRVAQLLRDVEHWLASLEELDAAFRGLLSSLRAGKTRRKVVTLPVVVESLSRRGCRGSLK